MEILAKKEISLYDIQERNKEMLRAFL